MLAAEGADIAINYSKDDEKAASILKQMEKSEVKTVLVKGDAGDYAEVERVVKETREGIPEGDAGQFIHY